MLYFNLNDQGQLVSVTSERSADAMAEQANALKDGNTYIATDAGRYSSPQFDVIAVPKVGDKVSQSFNGDSYPRGEIASISKTLKKITTTTGHAFWRVRNTGCWQVNGYASMIPGHHDERNPSF
jgi:hypothetical protein